MKLMDIPRTKPGVAVVTETIDALDGERSKLAQRAADLLGYRALQANVRGEKVITKCSGPLTEALLKLEIEVLNATHVIDYQLEESSRRTREAIYENFTYYVAGYFSPAHWQHTSLDAYERPIPEFVLDKAIRIKESVPDVQFLVQHLNDPKADPFLIAKLNQEIYFVEAWDEPRFEGQL